MRLPSFRIRTLMLAVALAAVPLGLLAVRAAREGRRSAASARSELQVQVTLAALAESKADVPHEAGEVISSHGGSSAGTGPDGGHWATEIEAWPGTRSDRVALHLEIEGGWDGGGAPRPIVITDRGAPNNAQAIARLTKAYAQRRWAYRITPPPPPAPSE